MSRLRNRQIVLASRPQGEPSVGNFRLVEADMPTVGPGQIVLQTLYLSLDPYMRGRMSATKSYAKPVEIGGVMPVCGDLPIPDIHHFDMISGRGKDKLLHC